MADSGEEVIDARIKDELESLNSASNCINKLENEVQRARATFKLQKDECRVGLMDCMRMVGKNNIVRSKTYYELLNHLLKIQGEVQKATQKFQKANSVYKAALETVSLAEEQLVGEDGGRVVFDSAWQDMLNHANLRFIEAEKEKRLYEAEHQSWSREFDGLKDKLSCLHRSNAKSICKSKPFYEMKRRFESKLQAERQNAEDLQLALLCNKQKYRMALNSLERISEELHVQRQLRTPGVGAESDTCSELSDTLTFNFDFLSDTSSQVSSGDLADFDSDLTFMADWEQDQSLFSKVSTRFNRSTSLSNLGDRNKFPLTTIPPSPLTIPQSPPPNTTPLSLPNNHLLTTSNFIPPNTVSDTTSKLSPKTTTTPPPQPLDFTAIPKQNSNPLFTIATTQQQHLANPKQQQPSYTTPQQFTIKSTTPYLHQQQPILKSTKTQLKANKPITTTITHNHPLNQNTTTKHYKPTSLNFRPFKPITLQQQQHTFTSPSKPILTQKPNLNPKPNPSTTTLRLSFPPTKLPSNLPLKTISTTHIPNLLPTSTNLPPFQSRELTLEGEEDGCYTEPQQQQPHKLQRKQPQQQSLQQPHSQQQPQQLQQHTQQLQQQPQQHTHQQLLSRKSSFTSSAFLTISPKHDDKKRISLGVIGSASNYNK